MKAMIFAAGLGTRLQPLTLSKPKALIEITGKPMIRLVIEKLASYGVTEIVINVHHFAEKIICYVEQNNHFGINIHISDETDQLLDTGGGLKKAAGFLKGNDPVILYNTDILCNLDLNSILEFHKHHKKLATIVVRKRETNRYLLFDKENLLAGWKNVKTGESKISKPQKEQLSPYAFSGIHIIDPGIFDHISQEGKFSIIDTYLELAKTNSVIGYIDNFSFWMDLGKPENIKKAEEAIKKGFYP